MDDPREHFVIYNQWEQHVPCPECCPTGFSAPPPADGRGVCHLTSQDQSNGLFVYQCQTCRKDNYRGTAKN